MAKEKSKKICKNCEWRVETGPEECRRFPPQVGYGEGFPNVKEDDFCGEFERKSIKK